jgi:diguanylate cyclase (GGDEF)-like protein/PAS domain S-box-containing protein
MSSSGRGVQILTAAFVLLLIASLMISYLYSRSILQEELFDVAQMNAHHSAAMVTHWLESLTDRLYDLAGLPEIQSMDWQRQRPLLETHTAVGRDWLAIGIVDSGGVVTATSTIPPSISEAVRNDVALEGRVVYYDPVRLPDTGDLVAVVAVPIFVGGSSLVAQSGPLASDGSSPIVGSGAVATDGGPVATVGGAVATDGGPVATDSGRSVADGSPLVVLSSPQPVGAVVGLASLDYLQTVISDMHIGDTGYGWIIDSEKRTVAHPVAEFLGNTDILSGGQGDARLAEIADRMSKGEQGIGFYQFMGAHKMAAYAPIELTGWSILSSAELHEALAPLASLRRTSWIVSAIALIIAAVIWYSAAKMEAITRASRRKYESLFDHANDGVLLFRLEDDGVPGRYVDANRRACDILGLTRDEVLLKNAYELVADEDAPRLQEKIGDLLERGHLRLEARCKTRSGSLVPLELSVSTFLLDQQRMVQVIARDITERTRLLEQLYDTRERLQITLQSIGDAVIATDDNGIVTFMNGVAESLTGWTAEDALGKPMSSIFHIVNEQTGMPVSSPVDEVIAKGRVVGLANHTILISRDGRKRPIADSAAPIRKADGSVVGVVMVFRDMTEEAEAQRQIRYLSYHDKLTGLYNRAGLEEQIKLLDVETCLPLSLIMGDLNGLKLVNDAFGHQVGDTLLIALAQILKDAARPGDIVARLSGDEFVILMPKASIDDAAAVSERIRDGCNSFSSEQVRPSIALGHATVSEATDLKKTYESLLGEAEQMMYTAKLRESRSIRAGIIASLKRSLYETSHEIEEHVKRMEGMAVWMGKALNLSDSESDRLFLLAGLHDIGKIAIPKTIIQKTEPLTPDERATLRKHTEIGYRIALSSPDLVPIADDILAHHEKWDGSGYPRGLKGNEIPFISRIIAIMDAYDAMTSDRPYRKVVSHEEAVTEIAANSGIQFDPGIVRVFVDAASRCSSLKATDEKANRQDMDKQVRKQAGSILH